MALHHYSVPVEFPETGKCRICWQLPEQNRGQTLGPEKVSLVRCPPCFDPPSALLMPDTKAEIQELIYRVQREAALQNAIAENEIYTREQVQSLTVSRLRELAQRLMTHLGLCRNKANPNVGMARKRKEAMAAVVALHLDNTQGQTAVSANDLAATKTKAELQEIVAEHYRAQVEIALGEAEMIKTAHRSNQNQRNATAPKGYRATVIPSPRAMATSTNSEDSWDQVEATFPDNVPGRNQNPDKKTLKIEPEDQ